MALLDNLQGYWKMEETSGTRYDETANNNDLADNNTVLYGTGKIGNAADFESTNSEFLSIDDNASLSITGDLTISCWVNIESKPGGFGYRFVGKWSGTPSTQYAYVFQFYDDSGTEKLLFAFRNSTGSPPSNNTDGYCTPTLNTGTWYHLAVVVDVSAATITFYVNGVAQSTTYNYQNATSIVDTTAPFTVGQAESAGYYDGLLDELGIWSRILTSDEITALYNSGSGLTYPFTTTNIKKLNSIAHANLKKINGVAIANVKKINTIA